MISGTGVKYDQDKLRFDLVPTYPQEQYVKVLTMGSKKYGDRNWEKGMKWSRLLASAERHLHAWKCGEDIDPESGLQHLAHAMTNLAFLLEFTNSYPQGDDRVLPYHKHPRIGLDIDEVVADFIGSYSKRYGIEKAESWDFDPKIKERIEELRDDKEFWMSITPKINPKDIPFEPVCYITSRPCPVEWTIEWLHNNGFTNAKVYCTYLGEGLLCSSKVDIAKQMQLNWFVDDRYSNFVELNEAGVCCFLFDAPHNQRYHVGYKRIKTLKDLPLFNFQK